MSLTDLLIFPAPGATADKVQHIVDFAIRGGLADVSLADELGRLV